MKLFIFMGITCSLWLVWNYGTIFSHHYKLDELEKRIIKLEDKIK